MDSAAGEKNSVQQSEEQQIPRKMVLSDEWYTPSYAWKALFSAFPKNVEIVVWDGFIDKNGFCKQFLQNAAGQCGIAGVQTTTDDFFSHTELPAGVTLLTTNPPFTVKMEAIEHVLRNGIPSVFLVQQHMLVTKAFRRLVCTYGATVSLVYTYEKIKFLRPKLKKVDNNSFFSLWVGINLPFKLWDENGRETSVVFESDRGWIRNRFEALSERKRFVVEDEDETSDEKMMATIFGDEANAETGNKQGDLWNHAGRRKKRERESAASAPHNSTEVGEKPKSKPRPKKKKENEAEENE